MSNKNDSDEFKKEFLWPLNRRVRRELNDHPLMESDEFNFITCLWCAIGTWLTLRCETNEYIITQMIQEMEVLDWFATENTG